MGSSLNQSRENNGKTINQSLQTSQETEERSKITLKIGTQWRKGLQFSILNFIFRNLESLTLF